MVAKSITGGLELTCRSITRAEKYLTQIGLSGKNGRIFANGKVLQHSLYGQKSSTVVFVRLLNIDFGF
jgi:hypothetical protein